MARDCQASPDGCLPIAWQDQSDMREKHAVIEALSLGVRGAGRRLGQFGLLVLLVVLVLQPAAALERALLVGVSHYPALPGRDLAGPVNDLRLMRHLLAEMAVPAEQVTVLAEEGASSGHLPTRANILRALARLGQQSQRGDWVLVYLAGHGAQVPQLPASAGGRPEQDGLDEVFLPRDTQQWDVATQTVRGALRDKELGAALRLIQSKGVNVWAIFDTCHAADMLRRPQAAVPATSSWRFVSPQDLRIPMALWADRLERSWAAWLSPAPRRLRTMAALQSEAGRAKTAGHLVTFFSSQKGEGTLEELRPDPLEAQQMRRYGLFTYELVRAAQGWRGSFAELAGRIELAYEQRPFPTPQFNGALSGRPLAGADHGRKASAAASEFER